jgi:hypothetical protein
LQPSVRERNPVVKRGHTVFLLIHLKTQGMPHLEITSTGQGHFHKYEDLKRKIYSGVVKSLAQPGRKQATVTEDFECYISYL